MKKLFAAAFFLIAATLILFQIRDVTNIKEEVDKEPQKIETSRNITGTIKKGETFFEVFKRRGLNIAELFAIREAAADVHHLKKVQPGQQYNISVDADNRIKSLSYWIGDDGVLEVTRKDQVFKAKRIPIAYEKKIEHISGIIKDNLISSIGEGRENLILALQLSDIFAWDIDFTSDLREDDKYKIVVEGLYLDGKFKKFGSILSAEFNNNDKTYHAYRFENNGKAGYYDADGKSLAKAFLKAPLDFRQISSYFSGSRLHPILKVYKPHHGIDYSAPAGTPVSALGDGKVVFAGYNGGYGNLIIIRHNNGYETYYGHLQEISKNISTGRTAEQGQVIGRVGTTGISTGPHLHFELRINNEPVNPLSVKLPSGESMPQQLMAGFRLFRDQMNTQLALITTPVYAFKEQSLR
ncbi:MAG: peptidoglycan DD-metalloendopeptidase family protein [Thermodesulfovibrionia bacterium]|nr:peptidoglycan DD-metalloendopeptidase family protein [Thermodesulfovibrionia bacterium]